MREIDEAMGNMSLEDQEKIAKMRKNYEDEINRLKAELAKQKKDNLNTIASLKGQYERDLRNIHNKHNDGISRLQGSHEEMVRELQEELDKEILSLRDELQQSKESIETIEEKKRQLEQQLSERGRKGDTVSRPTEVKTFCGIRCLVV